MLGYKAGSSLVGQAMDAAAKELLRSALETHFGRAPELDFETIGASGGEPTPGTSASDGGVS